MKGCVNMAMGSKAAVNTPAKAKYGPKGKACPLAKLPRNRITKAMTTANSEDIKTTLRAMTAQLQANYKGALAAMVPSDAGSSAMDMARWTHLYTSMVFAVYARHNRTQVQVTEALASVLAV
jgi:hypothetical protein